jgi:hypothetical protein
MNRRPEHLGVDLLPMEAAPKDGTFIRLAMELGPPWVRVQWGRPGKANWGGRFGDDRNLPGWRTESDFALDGRNGVPLGWIPVEQADIYPEGLATERTVAAAPTVKVVPPGRLLVEVAGVTVHALGATVTLNGEPITLSELTVLLDALLLAQRIAEVTP